MYNLSNKIDFSLIIPTYNRAKLLKECLTSILAQDYSKERYEVIICDDGSSDNTSEAAEYFIKKNRNILYFYQKHKGISAARNLGIMNARGEYLCFLADDYTLDKGYLKTSLRIMQDDRDIRVVRFGMNIKNNSCFPGVQHFIYRFSMHRILNEELNSCAATLSYSSETNNKIKKSYSLPASGGAIFKKSVFEDIGLFDQSLIIGEDTDMGFRLKAVGIPVFYCRYHLIQRFYETGLKNSLKKFFRNGRDIYPFLRKYPHYHHYIFNGFSIKNYALFLGTRIRMAFRRCVASLKHKPSTDVLIWPFFIVLFEVSYILGVLYSLLFLVHRNHIKE